MCGISGLINKNNESVDMLEIKTITNIISHRGPDGEGFLLENNFALGHRRLAIIDVSAASDQPMWYESKYAIVFNGEIYNYLEIKKDLEKLGYSFKTKSDTEVILIAYECWGSDCVKKFNGMWAFSIFDKEKNILFCSRDRFGIKPFYYSDNTDKFVFGSEIKQLLSYTDRKVNLKVLLDYLVLSLEEQSDETFFEGIKRLPPSHNLVYDLKTHKSNFERYYSLEYKPEIGRLNIADSVLLCKTDLIDSIRLRLRSDVEVGTCLSGGLDSSSIASIAAKEFKIGSNFKGIHAKSSEKYTDESDFAQMVADSGNIDIVYTEPSEDYFKKHIEKVTLIQEEPIGGPSVFMQYAVFEKAKQEGCIVMLDGQGGDETLLGYERYFPSLLNDVSFFRKGIEMFKYSRKSRLSFLTVLLYFFYFKFPSLRKKRLLKRCDFIKKEYLKTIDCSILYELSNAYKCPFELQKLEITRTQLPHLLKYEDKNSMAHSIESRLPFLDYRSVENAVSYNPKFKINDGWSKFILRKATTEYLPKEIGWRRNKRGFESPRTWLNNKDYFMPVIEESIILSKIMLKIDSKLSDDIIWKLFSIAIWEKKFGVKID
nr:asparagine synthase (glutamine-hydrolyzing) [uncultured Flavobacterium sp.]